VHDLSAGPNGGRAQSAGHSAQYTVCGAHSTIHSLQCAVRASSPRAPKSSPPAVCLQRAACSLQCAMGSMQCASLRPAGDSVKWAQLGRLFARLHRRPLIRCRSAEAAPQVGSAPAARREAAVTCGARTSGRRQVTIGRHRRGGQSACHSPSGGQLSIIRTARGLRAACAPSTAPSTARAPKPLINLQTFCPRWTSAGP